MRAMIFAVAVMMAGSAHALDFAQPVIEGVTSTMTVSAISIATQTATSVIVSTTALYRQVCIRNMDSTAFVSCGETVNVSTIQANSLFGDYLTTATAASFNTPAECYEVVPGHNFFCKSGSVTAPSRVVIIRKR